MGVTSRRRRPHLLLRMTGDSASGADGARSSRSPSVATGLAAGTAWHDDALVDDPAVGARGAVRRRAAARGLLDVALRLDRADERAVDLRRGPSARGRRAVPPR